MAHGSDPVPHVVVIGGGFGGLTATTSLARTRVQITLLDRSNHYTFQPLLYQVAMAGLSPADIAQPIRAIVHRQDNVRVLMAEAQRIDLDAQQVVVDGGETLHYDYLIVACGAITTYFGHDDWKHSTISLKAIEDAVAIRQRVLLAFELAERESDERKRAQLLSFVVIGGGPTGVELAGALAELSRTVLNRDFRNIDASGAKVCLLEGGPRILPSFAPDLSERAVAQLGELGVDVRVGAKATAIEPGVVRLKDEEIPCSVVLWAAGVRANPLTKTLGAPLDSSDRVKVKDDLSVPDHPEVFVIGDAALVLGEDGHPLPGVSPVAMQEARTVAKSIARRIEGKSSLPFKYFDKGSMATIGRSRAIAEVGRLHLSGMMAWLAWLFVHLWYLIGFKNRLIVMITWTWSYLTYRRGARIIVGRPAPFVEGRENPALLLDGRAGASPSVNAGAPPSA